MLRIIIAALRTGTTTESWERLQGAAPAGTKGRPALAADHCDGNAACETACPTTAITLSPVRLDGRRSFTLDYGACIFCGRCAEVCGRGALVMTGDYALAVARRDDMVQRVDVPFRLGEERL